MKKGYLSEMFVSFQGEGLHAGRRHLFIRMAGCNLRCRYCDTPDSLERADAFQILQGEGFSESVPNPVATTELLTRVGHLLCKEGQIDGVAITGGEPLLQADFLAQLLGSEALPRPRLLETSGILVDRLGEVLPLIDVVSMDIKLPSNTGEPAFWKEHARFLALAAHKAYVKILVDRRTDPFDVEQAVDLVRLNAPQAPVFLQPISNPTGLFDVAMKNLSVFYSIARQHVENVRISPQMHKLLSIP